MSNEDKSGLAYVCKYDTKDGWGCTQKFTKGQGKYPPSLNMDNEWYYGETFLTMENEYALYEKYARNKDPKNFRKIFEQTFKKVVDKDAKQITEGVEDTLVIE